MKRSPVRLVRLLVLSLTLSSMVSSMVAIKPATAQSIWERLFGRRIPEGRASGRTRGGAVRDELCSAEAQGKSLVALVPESNQGDTISPHPTFFFYIPFSSRQNRDLAAEFMLLTEERNYLLDAPLRVSLPDQPGIVKVTVPDTFTGLAVGERYNWYFSILCEEWELSRNPFVSGWVERVAADGVEDTWHEVLVTLSDNQAGDRLAWASLLSLFDLEEFSDNSVEPLQPIAP
ncbi:MAG: DUF928 domain-containing protein [Cyanobacteria bacterium J06627_8]